MLHVQTPATVVMETWSALHEMMEVRYAVDTGFVPAATSLACCLVNLVAPPCFGLFLSKSFRKRKRDGADKEGRREEWKRGEAERKEEQRRDAAPLHPRGPRKWGRELFFSADRSRHGDGALVSS